MINESGVGPCESTKPCKFILPAVKADQQSKASTPSNSTERSLGLPMSSSDPTPSSQAEPMDASAGGMSQLKINPGGVSEATVAQVGYKYHPLNHSSQGKINLG